MAANEKTSFISIARLAPMVGTILVGLAAGTGYLSYTTLEESRIGSPDYGHIVTSKDFLADILPPPLFPIEAMLDVHLMLDDPSRVEKFEGRIAELHKQYNERLVYWQENLPGNSVIPEESKKIYNDEMIADFNAAWKIIEGDIIPAVKAGQIESAAQMARTLEPLYNRATAANGRILEKMLPAMAADESEAAANVLSAEKVLLSGSAINVLTVLLSVLAMVVFLVRPMRKLTGVMSKLAHNDLTVDVPFVNRPDELGLMARSVGIFKSNEIEARRAKAEALPMSARWSRRPSAAGS